MYCFLFDIYYYFIAPIAQSVRKNVESENLNVIIRAIN